jgi:myo-inositol-1(or 4)-monophosphatase
MTTPLMQAVKDVVLSAGPLIRDAFLAPNRPAYTLKGQQDYLTETDLAVEQFVRHKIAQRFPQDSVLGEEGGGRTDTERLWIVDPIDGTANFARNIAHFCVSLGVMVNGALEAGAIYDPMRDELFLAGRGQGAWLNGRRLQVSHISALPQSSAEIGWSSRKPLDGYLNLVSRTMQAGCAVRRAGSGALGLAYVSAGRIECYAEQHINAWDVAAGLLLVSEAGGRVNNFWATDGLHHGNAVLASNALLADRFSHLTGIAWGESPAKPDSR